MVIPRLVHEVTCMCMYFIKYHECYIVLFVCLCLSASLHNPTQVINKQEGRGRGSSPFYSSFGLFHSPTHWTYTLCIPWILYTWLAHHDQVTSMSTYSIKYHMYTTWVKNKRKPRFDSKFLKIEKRYNKIDFSIIILLSYGTLFIHIWLWMAAQQSIL